METVLEEPGGGNGLELESLLPFCRDDLSLGCGRVADDPAGLTGDEDEFMAEPAWPLLDDLEANSASEAVLRCIRGRDCGGGGGGGASESVT